MTNEQASSNASDRLVVSADIAYQKAGEFVWHLGNLAEWARLRVPAAKNVPKGAPPHPPPDRHLQGETFARAFLSCFDLEPLLTEDLRSAARRVHSVDAGPIRFGELEPALSVIEAVAHGLSTTFRNSVYGGRRHPLEPDFDRVANEAKARAKERQAAQGGLARPDEWENDYDELWVKETRAAVRERLGVKNDADALDLMVREWNALDAAEALTAVSRLRFTGIDFDDLRQRLIREANAVMTEAERAGLGHTGGDNGGATPPAAHRQTVTSNFAHGDDFSWIIFARQMYSFTKGNQAESIRALWDSWEKAGRLDGCGLSEKTIGEKCGSSANDFRLAHVFRDHPAWGRIIRPMQKGVFALFAETPQNHTS